MLEEDVICKINQWNLMFFGHGSLVELEDVRLCKKLDNAVEGVLKKEEK